MGILSTIFTKSVTCCFSCRFSIFFFFLWDLRLLFHHYWCFYWTSSIFWWQKIIVAFKKVFKFLGDQFHCVFHRHDRGDMIEVPIWGWENMTKCGEWGAETKSGSREGAVLEVFSLPCGLCPRTWRREPGSVLLGDPGMCTALPSHLKCSCK